MGKHHTKGGFCQMAGRASVDGTGHAAREARQMIPTQTLTPDIRCSRPSMMTRTFAAVSFAVVGLGLAACSTHSARTSSTPSVNNPAGPASSTPAAHATGRSSSTTQPSPTASTRPAQPASFDLGYQPLWPFATLADAQEWQASNRSGGHQPWHADAGATALAFTRGYLGFTEIDRVMSSRFDADGAHIGVGDLLPENHPLTAAVLHLVRFGDDPDSPWEIVGSDDTTFSLETPAYGSAVTSPVTVGGRITGPEPRIHLCVRQLPSEAPLGTDITEAEARLNAPWSGPVSFTGATEDVLTIVASEGGGAQGVDRFAIQAART
jgi:hypothetical protein